MFCYFVCVMLFMVVLARRVGAETQLQRVTAGWWNQWCTNVQHWSCGVMFWSGKSPPTVSSYRTSRLCHVWLCDVASPIPSWHRLWRGGVTFQWLAVFGCGLLLDVVCCELLLWRHWLRTSYLFTVMCSFVLGLFLVVNGVESSRSIRLATDVF